MDNWRSSFSAAIRLEAVSQERNIARRYAIEANSDLFGAIVVRYSWGRIGTRGQSKTVSFADEASAQRFIDRKIKDRMSAQRRIGAAYIRIA